MSVDKPFVIDLPGTARRAMISLPVLTEVGVADVARSVSKPRYSDVSQSNTTICI